jgi:cytosine/adenosine deaminase-related metal-dependent hydrolase
VSTTEGLDLVVHGGTVVTMDAKRRVLVGDVLVRGGAIVGIGRVPSNTRARSLDARGCVVIPGFVQAHVHLCQALFRGMADDLPLMTWLRERIWPLEAAHDERSIAASARLGLHEMMRAGTTTILDMGTVREEDAVFGAMHESGIRGVSGKAMMDRGRGVPKGLRESTKDSLRESEALHARWSGAGRLDYAFAPRFILSCTEKLLRSTAEIAKNVGAIVHSHAAEHRGERDEVRAQFGGDDVDVLARFGIAGPRTVLAHGVQLTAAQMRACGKRGTRFVHCPSANLKLASGIADVVSMRAAGMIVGLGADGAPCNNRMDPLTELRSAALLAKGRRLDASVLPAMDALAMATIDGARVLGIDDRVGSIEIGKRADLAVIAIDEPHTEPGGDAVGRLVYGAAASDVRHVVIDGDVVVQHGEHRTLDRDHVVADARKQAKLLVARAGL